MLVPEVYRFARDTSQLLTKALKDHGYFTFTSRNEQHFEIKYTEMEFTDLHDQKFYVYLMQDPTSLNAFAEYRKNKARKNTLFSGKVVPTKLFENTSKGKEDFVQWVYDSYTNGPIAKKKVDLPVSFFGTRGTKRVQLREAG